MTSLLRIAVLWRPRWPHLLAGLVVTLAAVAAQLALSASAARVALGLMVAATLGWLGPLRVALRYGERLVVHDALFRALADLRTWFFARLAARSAGGLGFVRGGDVLARLVGDIGALDGLYIRVVLPAVSAVLLVPVLLVAGLRVGPLPALGVATLFAVAAIAMPLLSAHAVRTRAAATLAGRAGLRVAALDGLTGLREVRAFAAEGRVLQLVQAREAVLLGHERRLASVLSRLSAVALLAGQTALAVALATGHGVAGVVLVFLLVPALELAATLGVSGVAAGQAQAAAARVLAVADAPPPVPDPARPVAAPPSGSLRLEAVHFGWAADRAPVFDGLTLDIPEGCRVALLGASGAGKSTLAALLLKVAAPQSGRVLLGGTDIADLTAADMRGRIAWLSQETHLFDDTIAANLRLAAPEADEAALWHALSVAHLDSFVRGLPDGLETWVGEGGARLSGGQGRRLALARTLLSPAPILLLDEPAAGLDADTERDFLLTLNEAAQTRTVILIVHRLLGVERLDRIYRLSAGRAVAAAG